MPTWRRSRRRAGRSWPHRWRSPAWAGWRSSATPTAITWACSSTPTREPDPARSPDRHPLNGMKKARPMGAPSSLLTLLLVFDDQLIKRLARAADRVAGGVAEGEQGVGDQRRVEVER